jgi:hypothetical protein
MAQRNLKSISESSPIRPLAEPNNEKFIESDRIERAISVVKDDSITDVMRVVLRDYGDTLDYLKDR